MIRIDTIIDELIAKLSDAEMVLIANSVKKKTNKRKFLRIDK